MAALLWNGWQLWRGLGGNLRLEYAIHGSALSPFTRKVVLPAMEKGIAFESRDLNPYAPPDDFEAMNPLKRVPIVQDGGYTLSDSSAICGYFEAKHGG